MSPSSPDLRSPSPARGEGSNVPSPLRGGGLGRGGKGRKTLATLFTLLCALFLWLGISWKLFLDTPIIPAGTSLIYDFTPGSSIRTLAADLHAKGLLAHPHFLMALAYYKGTARKLRAGEYLFIAETKPEALLDQIAMGRVVDHRFTIVEGWTYKQLLAALRADHELVHTLTTTTTAEILQKLGLSLQHPNLEGLFLPATYYFNKGMTDLDVLKLAYQKMEKKLTAAWQQRAPNLLYQSPYEALIAASLVEKETAQPNERPIVAGVIMRRLQTRMPLQIDATLIYGLGDSYAGRLNLAALHQDTPYNTYLHKGLPPTPIAMPSLGAIEAALHPDASQILYFVAKGDGTHQFSVTLQQQNQAVILYQIGKSLPEVGRKIKTTKPASCSWYFYKDTFLQNLCLLL